MLDYIIDAFESFLSAVKNIFKRIINGVLNFFRDVVGYFKGLRLKQGRDIPFLADRAQFLKLIHNAPVKNVGIFTATYNEETDEIENVQDIQADSLDADTCNILGNEKLVVLT